MSENHKTHYLENIPAYALGALDIDESRQLEEHLEMCQVCQQELSQYQAVSDGLLEALPPVAPDPRIKKELAARLNNKKDPGPNLQSIFQSFFQFSIKRTAAAVAVIFLLGLNLIFLLQVRQLKIQQAELVQRIQTEQSAIAMLAYPGTQIISAGEDTNGSLLINTQSKTAILLTHNLPELPANKTYQIWLIDEQGNRVSGGLFNSPNIHAYNIVEIDETYAIGDFVALGVTIEPWGGSPGPTGENVLKVTF